MNVIKLLQRYLRLPKFFVTMIPFMLFILVTGYVLWPGLVPPKGMMLFGDDIDRLSYFWISFFNQEIAQGHLPFWNPFQFSGLPYTQAFHSGIWYLPHWILSFVSLQYAFAWYFAFHMFLAMCTMYMLVRTWSTKVPAMVAAIAYSLSGPFAAQIWAGHFDALAAFAMMPVVFRVFFWAIEKVSAIRTVAFAFAIALMFVSGYPVITLFALEMLGMGTLYYALLQRSVKPLITSGVAVALAFGLISVQYFPNSEYVGRTVRSFDISYAWLAIGALEPTHLVEYIMPFIYGDQYTYFGPWQFYHERIGYIGVLPLVLGIVMIFISFLKLRKNTHAWIFIGTAIFGLWVSFAYNAPFDLNRFLYEHVPLYQSIRIPTRHVILFVFGMSALSGFALTYLKNKWIQFGILLVVIVDMTQFTKHFVGLKELPTVRHEPYVLEQLQKDFDLVRYVPNFNQGAVPRDVLDFAAPSYYGVYSVTGYDPSMLRNYFEFISAMNGMSEPSIRDYDVQVPYLDLLSPYVNFLNIKYVLVPPWQDPIGRAYSDWYTMLREDGQRMYRLYQNNRVLPRFFFTRDLLPLADRQAIYQAIVSRQIKNISNTVLVDRHFVPLGTPLSSDCPLGAYPKLSLVLYEANKILLSSDGACGAILATSEVYYPGWHAYLDDKETPIIEGNLAFRTLFVPKGVKKIEFAYVPTSMYQGAIVSILSTACAIVWVVLEKLWSKKHS